MDWSFQLYSARKFEPWDKILTMLGRLGYAQVEGFGGVYGDPAGFRAELDKNGLTMPTGHFSIDMLENDFDGARRIADALGIKLLICPYLDADKRPANAAGWTGFGERLAKVGEKAKAGGYGFAWHNHDFEFKPQADGSVPMAAILEGGPNLEWEMDVAWVVRGGSDPFAWIEAHKGRITAAHVKDIAPAGQNADEDGWADVGQGTVPWARLLPALKAAGVSFFVMEHDNPKDDRRFATRSLAAASTY